jgi:flagellar biosynthesis/type III secretory pathway protein FliH
MAMAHTMKNLAEQIVASRDVRIRALGDLLLGTKKTLKDFAEERHAMGRKQRKDLKDFQDGLSKSVQDMLKDFHKEHHKMGSEQAKELSEFSHNLTTNTQKTLRRFLKEHRQMGSEQAKELSEFVASLTKDVGSMVSTLRRRRGEMSAERKSRRERDVKQIESYVKNKLKEFDASHGRMSDALRKSLAAYVNDIARGVRTLLQEYHADMTQAGHFWERTLTGVTLGAATPSLEIHNKVATVREAIEEERPRAEEPHPYVDIEEKVLGYINQQHNGVKVGDMEPVFGVPRLRLGVLAKKLLDEGKIRKEGGLYYRV